ncbi:hypothetical protein Hthe01_01880 [Hydrogenophilus thermoluteolus]|uniref:MlaA family lipoprotein n=1 Tax=Hydrogenophilus thermoluteolus TaxID=297 RepID=UPI0024A3AE8D|nr:VacJ family lipoprotein [Hydrogenophilus thermoluteolus]GLW59839.1 hypothetical protein Hthe01_01880 [Hydrogenophilus thermoluteolus]
MRQVTQRGFGSWLGRAVTIGALVVAVSGCATTPQRVVDTAGPSPSNAEMSATPTDPWEGFNRTMFAVNEALDRAVLKPVAQAYDTVAPEPVKKGVSNFFGNLGDLWIGFNNLLQGKPSAATNDWMRFAFNSTFGLFGLFDIASEAGLPKHNEDFGQTLARWGVGDGPYLVLPILGPRTLRDAVAWPVDRLGDLTTHLEDDTARFAVKSLDIVGTRARLLPLDAQADAAIDKYAYVRDSYLQRRQYLIYDGNPPVVYENYE